MDHGPKMIAGCGRWKSGSPGFFKHASSERADFALSALVPVHRPSCRRYNPKQLPHQPALTGINRDKKKINFFGGSAPVPDAAMDECFEFSGLFECFGFRTLLRPERARSAPKSVAQPLFGKTSFGPIRTALTSQGKVKVGQAMVNFTQP